MRSDFAVCCVQVPSYPVERPDDVMFSKHTSSTSKEGSTCLVYNGFISAHFLQKKKTGEKKSSG